ncbi:hypothetical protein [Paenibacillus pini]|uniref:DUF4129 domain-containing protein n=1 Tax=Paenibacillus pini JCM 16418 TaxID=1236976 RepID=W7YIY3_9BACL|nr:hypothetical protein [Paenibacillus pini]GAF08427.1 hypothetical protein JCM16418_2501 [Paenibacillus pini JCM 16418]
MRNKDELHDISRTWPTVIGFSLLEVAAVYPFVLLLSLYVLHTQPLILLVLLWIYHICGTLIGIRQVRGDRTRIAAVSLIILAIILPAVLFGFQILSIFFVVLLLAVAARGLLAGRKQLWQLISWPLPMISMGAALVLYIAASKVGALHPYRFTLYGFSMITLFTFLLRLNSGHVRNASYQEQTDRMLLGRILFANRWMTWLVILVIALLSTWSKLGVVLVALRGLILRILQYMGGQFDAVPKAAPEQSDMLDWGDMGQDAGQPLWLRIITDALAGIVILAVAVIIVILLYKLIRRWLPSRLQQWIQRISQRIGLLRSIRQNSDNMESDLFVDEIERISPKPRKSRIKRREPEYNGNDPRRAYESMIRRAIQRGYAYRASRTPAENGARLVTGESYTELSPEKVERLIKNYNDARYGR